MGKEYGGGITVIIKADTDGNRAEEVCDLMWEYGVNQPDSIKKTENNKYVICAEMNNKNHTTENIVKLYHNINKRDGLKVEALVAETSTGKVKLDKGRLVGATYKKILGDYKEL